MKDYKTLNVWKETHELTLLVYKQSASFPREEKYGITSQLRISAASIPTNIAEGCGRDGDAELKRFLQIGMGSACETEYLLLLSNDLKLVNSDEYEILQSKITKIMKMLTSFIKKIRYDNTPN